MNISLRWMSRDLTATGLALLLATVTVLAQQASTQPLADRDNPLLIGKRDLNKGQMEFYSLDKEVAIGRQLAGEVDRTSRIVNDPLIAEYVNRVAQNLVLNSDSKVPFTIKVIDSNEVNAFALPGGFLYVHRGLIEAAENEAELAGVLAHEISHVAARHGVEQASKAQFMNYASIPLIFLGGIGGYVAQQVAGLAVPLTFLKFSRGAEKEADRLGAQYMWAAGYDPNALITFFEKLQAKEKKKAGTLSKLFSSHPMNEDRIKEVRALVARFPARGEYQLSTSEFKDVKSRVLAMSASRPSTGGNRPTLKRRPTSQGDDPAGSADPANRPTLERTPGGTRSPSSTSQTGSDRSEAPERPTLKRGGATESEAEKPASTPAPEGAETPATGDRPTLKRKPAAE